MARDLNKLFDLKDTRFILYEQLKISDLQASPRFQDQSRDTIDMILATAEKIALNDFAPVNSHGDEVGCVLEGDKVRVPPLFHAPFAKYCTAGFVSMAEDHSSGGQNVPITVSLACHEFFFAANFALSGFMGLTHSAAKVLDIFGTNDQKQKFMKPLYEGKYAGTITLTEPQAGSDLGAISLKAQRREDGRYCISGQKIFITGGDQDLTENIIHIVLGRIEGDPPGTKGLSCFVVPKIRIRNDGTLGGNNDIVCTGIERKMGLKGSPTCALSFGANRECIGELLGPARKGIMVTFHAMNEQRLLVGFEGLSQATAAYLHALTYAKERFQGSELRSSSSAQVPIIRHPDVKRNLMWMKCYTEGMRALLLYTACCIDRLSVGNSEGQRQELEDIVQILTPVCKAYCTDKAFDVCTRAIQVHGGYGYCKDYKVEQFARDCKITSIFEGTNGIQAMDLVKRKISMREGKALETVVDQIKQQIVEAKKAHEFAAYIRELDRSTSMLYEISKQLADDTSSEKAYLAFSWATTYLDLFGDILLGWMLLWQAALAAEALLKRPQSEVFYRAKVNTATFYIGSLLPFVYGKIEAIKRKDDSLLGMDESLFFH